MNPPIFTLISLFILIKTDLPSIGKFAIIEYTEQNCDSKIRVVKLSPPDSECLSVLFSEGIKPISYNASTKELTINTYTTNSCYSNDYKTFTLKCDSLTCNPVQFSQNDQRGIICSYVGFPSIANFTFNKYNDKECLIQTGVAVLKGNSHCWKLNNKTSITPVKFNLDNLKDTSIFSYDNPNCTGNSHQNQNITCDGETCFTIESLGNNEYFTCSYIKGSHLMLSSFIYFLIFVIF